MNPCAVRIVGFCGADDSVDPALLRLLSEKHEWIEWGVLFRSDKEGSPRYASAEWVQALSTHALESDGRMRIAGHLCGNYALAAVRGDPSFVRKLQRQGFKRVQVNPTAANGVDLSTEQDAARLLKKAISDVPEMEWIVQAN